MMRALVAAALLAAPLPIVPARVAAAATADRADALAAAVLPRADIVAVRVPRFDAAYRTEIATDTRMAEVEKRHPGATLAITAMAHEEAVKGYGEAIDLLQSDVAALYRARFTPAELATLATFFATPTGRAMIALSAESSGDTATEFEANRRAKLIGMMQNPDERTKADLMGLMRSGLLPKVRAVNPEIAALSARRFDDVSKIVAAAVAPRKAAIISSYNKKASR